MKIEQDIMTPLLQWFENNKRILPWRESRDPYRIWVSEIMLQQTRVEAVKPYYNRFMEELPTVSALSSAKEERLLKLWEGLGYYNRVRNLQKAAIIIEEEYNGKFPEEYELLLKLPGIGEYTAGAVASIAFEKPVAAVDGNVLRIISRLCLYDEDVLSQKAKKEVKQVLEEIMIAYANNHTDSTLLLNGSINQALMELGATICVPNGAPHCEACPWKNLCEANKQNLWSEYPKKAPKKKRRIEEKTVLIVGDGDKLLLHKRKDKGLLAGMYELPSIEGHVSENSIVDYLRELSLNPLRIKSCGKAKHIFSHIEWHMEGYQVVIEPIGFDSKTDIERDQLLGKRDMGFIFFEDIKKEYAIPSAFSAYTEYMDIHV